MVVVAKKIDWLTVDLYVPVMLMDYSLMNSGSVDNVLFEFFVVTSWHVKIPSFWEMIYSLW